MRKVAHEGLMLILIEGGLHRVSWMSDKWQWEMVAMKGLPPSISIGKNQFVQWILHTVPSSYGRVHWFFYVTHQIL